MCLMNSVVHVPCAFALVFIFFFSVLSVLCAIVLSLSILYFVYDFNIKINALNSQICADVPLRNYSHIHTKLHNYDSVNSGR